MPWEDQLVVAHLARVLHVVEDNDMIVKTKRVAINFADSVAGAEVETGFTFPDKCKVLDVTLDVTVKEETGTTKTIIIGNETDPNGFAAGVLVDDVAIVEPTLASGAVTLGALLYTTEAAGALTREPDISSGGEKLVWTPGSNDFAELAGYIIVTYIDLTVPS